MIRSGDYYSIVDKENILSLLDGIEHKIIWMCHQNFILRNLMFSIYMGQDPNNPTYMESLSGRNISHVRRSKGTHEDSTEVLSLGCIK